MENRYVRKINLFNPETDLAVDGQDLVIKKKKRPVNPADGLLDDAVKEKVIPAGRKAGGTSGPARGRAQASPPTTSRSQPDSAQTTSPVASEPAAQPIVGEAPDAIMDDFPEPIDL